MGGGGACVGVGGRGVYMRGCVCVCVWMGVGVGVGVCGCSELVWLEVDIT